MCACACATSLTSLPHFLAADHVRNFCTAPNRIHPQRVTVYVPPRRRVSRVGYHCPCRVRPMTPCRRPPPPRCIGQRDEVDVTESALVQSVLFGHMSVVKCVAVLGGPATRTTARVAGAMNQHVCPWAAGHRRLCACGRLTLDQMASTLDLVVDKSKFLDADLTASMEPCKKYVAVRCIPSWAGRRRHATDGAPRCPCTERVHRYHTVTTHRATYAAGVRVAATASPCWCYVCCATRSEPSH